MIHKKDKLLETISMTKNTNSYNFKNDEIFIHSLL